MALDQVYLDRIKTFEGFTAVAKWDYAQHTNGFGTKATHPGERIDEVEADRRFREAITNARRIVDTHAGEWDEGTKAALTSLTFNAGTAWIRAGLGDAVRANDIDGVRASFVKYVKAGGEVLQGLVNRRQAEVEWIGSGVGTAQPLTDRPVKGPPAPPELTQTALSTHPQVVSVAWQTDVIAPEVKASPAPPPTAVAATSLPALTIDPFNTAGLDLSARSWQALADLAIRDMLVTSTEDRGEADHDADQERLPSSALSSLSPARVA